MDQERSELLRQLHHQVASGAPCSITVHEGDGNRRIRGRIASVSAESVLVHEAGIGSIDIYPLDSVVSLSAAPG